MLPANAEIARACLRQMEMRLADAEADLARLDAAIGDGDHGAGMMRGIRAAVASAEGQFADAGAVLMQAGTAFADAAGGASGALVGAALAAAGDALDGVPRCSSAMVAYVVSEALAAVRELGGAKPGDKTMIDTLAPFSAALDETLASSPPLVRAWQRALPAAAAGAEATAGMLARKGRAARLGERARGHRDPGAVSTLILLEAAGEAFAAAEAAARAARSPNAQKPK